LLFEGINAQDKVAYLPYKKPNKCLDKTGGRQNISWKEGVMREMEGHRRRKGKKLSLFREDMSKGISVWKFILFSLNCYKWPVLVLSLVSADIPLFSVETAHFKTS
jgi:hypothetical protein